MTSLASSSAQSPQQPEKADLRRRLLRARQAIPERVWRQKSDLICAYLQSWPRFQTAHCLLAYWSFRNEPDLSPLMNHQRCWGLPRCSGQELIWQQWQGPEALQTGKFGILEPAVDAPVINPADVDLILVPAVACDIKGYRLGYGGGFYDRMLSQPQWSHKSTIAVIFEYARLPALPSEAWDRPVQGICTETGLYLSEVI